jgi:hypothetical protein
MSWDPDPFGRAPLPREKKKRKLRYIVEERGGNVVSQHPTLLAACRALERCKLDAWAVDTKTGEYFDDKMKPRQMSIGGVR